MGDCPRQIPGPYPLKPLVGFDNHCQSKSRAPAYSLGLRINAQKPQNTPGPYKIEDVDHRGKYPYQGWTMESAGYKKENTAGPSPLSYAPEKIKPYTPAYSLGLKLPSAPIRFGPSPADYFPQFGPKPGYTIGSPYKNLTKFSVPGPQAETPTNLYKTRAPSYSLGLKGNASNSPIGPGPKYYPNRIVQSHAFSFGLKHGKCAPPLITHEDSEC